MACNARDRPVTSHRTTLGDRVVPEVWVEVAGFPDSDSEERAELASRLRTELIAAEVGTVSRPPAAAPTGAKGAALEWAQLLVTLTGSLPALLAAVRAWHDRHPHAAVTLEIEGDRVTLSDRRSPEGRAMLEDWLHRHGDG
jgi:Effector Associated Constant Component 1